MAEWLEGLSAQAFFGAYPECWVGLFMLLGWLAAPMLWRLVVFVPLRLSWQWREAAQQELDLPLEPYPDVWVLWRQARSAAAAERVWRWLFRGVSALALGFVAWRFGVGWPALWGAAFSLWLLMMSAIDARTRLLPDGLTLSCLWLGLSSHLVRGDLGALAEGVWGVLLGYGVLWGAAWVFKRLTAQEGMGHGDFKLFAALGAWLGWVALPWVLFLAAGLGVLWALASGRGHRAAIPFGPSLALAGWLVWLWGPIY
ncbi:MAG: prepilin peptidase [Neisseriaceae bacterium]|nr:prepilin peptidase [Neisseriaceae bacterium]